MLDFEEATRAAAEQLAGFADRADEAHAGASAALELALHVEAQVKADRDEFAGAAAECSESIAAGSDDQKLLVGEVGLTLDAMIELIESLEEEVVSQVEATKISLSNLGREIESLDQEIDATLTGEHEGLQALLDRIGATEARLEDATSEMVSQLAIVADEVAAQQLSVEERVAYLQSYFSEECLPTISEKAAELVETAGYLAQSVQTTLTNVQEYNQREAISIVDVAVSDQLAEVDRLVAGATEVHRSLERMAEGVQSAAQTALSAHKSVDDALASTNLGLETVMAFIASVEDLRCRLEDH